MRNLLISIAAASLIVPAGAVLADPPAHAKAYGKYKHKNKHRAEHRDEHRSRYDDRGRYDERSRYDDRGRYYEPRRLSNNDRIWRGDDGRYYCRRDNGTPGLLVGGSVDNMVDRRYRDGRERTVGSILEATGSALFGREINRGGLRCR